MSSSAALASIIESNSIADAEAALKFCSSIVTNVATDPVKYGSLKASSKGLMSKLTSKANGEAALIALGFHLEDEYYVFDASACDPRLQQQHAAAAVLRFRGAAFRHRGRG